MRVVWMVRKGALREIKTGTLISLRSDGEKHPKQKQRALSSLALDFPTTAHTVLSLTPLYTQGPKPRLWTLDIPPKNSIQSAHCLPALVTLPDPHCLAIHGGSHAWQDSTSNVLCCAWHGPHTMKDELDNSSSAGAKLIDFTSKRATCQSTPPA